MDLFRKQCIENISNPEQLNDYIRVTTAPVWFFLAAMILLLTGIVIWGCFGTVSVVDGEGVTKMIHFILFSEI